MLVVVCNVVVDSGIVVVDPGMVVVGTVVSMVVVDVVVIVFEGALTPIDTVEELTTFGVVAESTTLILNAYSPMGVEGLVVKSYEYEVAPEICS